MTDEFKCLADTRHLSVVLEASAQWAPRLEKLEEVLEWAVDISTLAAAQMSPLERQGLVHLFELCHEKAYSCLHSYLRWQGVTHAHGPRDVIREAFALEIIKNGEAWMDLNACRGVALKSHHNIIAIELCARIQKQFFPLMRELVQNLKGRSC